MVKKTLILDLILACFGPNLVPKFFSVGSTSIRCYTLLQASLHAISSKINQPNLRKWQKKLVSGPVSIHLTQIWAPKNFFVDFTSTTC